MNPIIKPVYFLMNQLTYRSKFLLIASVFAIPLAVFAWQLAFSHHQQAEQAKLTKTGLVYLREATELLRDIELLRDASVVISWKSNSILNRELEDVSKRAYRRTLHLLDKAPTAEDRKFLSTLKLRIENRDIIKGNESERIDGVYEDAHVLIQKAYAWHARLAYSYVSNLGSESEVLSLISMLNESERYTYALGMVRTLGSLYLGQTFVESHGVDAIEKAYRNLTQKLEELGVKNTEYERIITKYPHVRYDSVESAMTQARDLLYKHLIESMSPEGDARLFYKRLTELYAMVYAHSDELLNLADRLTQAGYEKTMKGLIVFYISVGLIGLLILYLTAGLYQSVGVAISGLSASAERVADGKYDTAIEIDAHDELAVVAKAMDQMRLSIKEREEKLELMSQTDGLTQLFNRPFFDKAIEISLANSRRNGTPMSVVMMDIDHFKAVNDTYGHQAGDDCLKLVASLMKSQYQRQTDVVARYGGEEFIVILYGQNLDQAVEQTEKLRRTVEASTVHSEGKEIKFTASFGVASLVPPVNASSKELIALADTLLYQSKETGRNKISAQDYDENNPMHEQIDVKAG